MAHAKTARAGDSPPIFSRGEPSRRALLIAGAAVFGEKGLEGATTREIAGRAQQNIAAIAYYFGSKEGLYLAIAREIGIEISQRLGPLVEAAAQLRSPTDAAAAMELLKRILTTMIGTMLTAEESTTIAHFIVREQQHPSAAFDLFYEGGMRRVHETITQLLAVALGLPVRDRSTVLRAHAVLGQVLGFRVARAAILRRTGWKRIGRAEAEQIADAVIAGLDLMFAGAARSARRGAAVARRGRRGKEPQQ